MSSKVLQPFAAVLGALGSLLPRKAPSGASAARVVRPWRDDALRSYPTTGLTPARAVAILHAADAGFPQQQFELFDEMLQKWPRLAAVANTRRLALTALDWEVVPAVRRSSDSGAARRAAPQRVAEFCTATLARLDSLHDALDHLSSALGYGVAVAELVWEDSQLVDIVPVPQSRLIVDASEPWRLRVRTDEAPVDGVALDENPSKWIVHTPRAATGRWFDGGLLRSSVLLYLAQNLSFKDWLIYSQLAGMPLRVAQFDPGTPENDKRALLTALESLGTEAVAAFGKNIDVKLIEAGGAGDKPYQPLQQYCNTEVTILWLGQHLTTDLTGNGSRAAAEVHDRVREDLLADDIADEGRTLRRDLLTPLVRARFGADTPLPTFRRSIVESIDTRALADVLAVAARQLGLRVPRAWAHRALGIPQAVDGEATLETTTSNGGAQ